MSDPSMEHEHLAKAERHIAEGERRVAAQRAPIVSMVEEGRDTGPRRGLPPVSGAVP